MANEKYDIEEELRKWLKDAERVVIVGIGNPIRMDDYVGVKIVQDLQSKVSDKVMLIEAETVPENHMQEIIDFKPTHILLIDAATQGLRLGEMRLIAVEQLGSFIIFSTHMFPLRVFCEHILSIVKAKIGLLLIEPEKTDFGETLTPRISGLAKRAAEILVAIFQMLFSL